MVEPNEESLENRFRRFRPTRVQIPPQRLVERNPVPAAGSNMSRAGHAPAYPAWGCDPKLSESYTARLGHAHPVVRRVRAGAGEPSRSPNDAPIAAQERSGHTRFGQSTASARSLGSVSLIRPCETVHSGLQVLAQRGDFLNPPRQTRPASANRTHYWRRPPQSGAHMELTAPAESAQESEQLGGEFGGALFGKPMAGVDWSALHVPRIVAPG